MTRSRSKVLPPLPGLCFSLYIDIKNKNETSLGQRVPCLSSVGGALLMLCDVQVLPVNSPFLQYGSRKCDAWCVSDQLHCSRNDLLSIQQRPTMIIIDFSALLQNNFIQSLFGFTWSCQTYPLPINIYPFLLIFFFFFTKSI